MQNKSLSKHTDLWGWLFVAPASVLIFVLSFYPMVQAFMLSLQSGLGNNLRFSGIRNYARLFQDSTFLASVANVFEYLIVQVPIMLILALVLATILNQPKLKFKGLFRTIIFLP
ncbi:MAG: sugar ABC transporter permease, partial [Treponema sp.]|nr:sugar ABC transporter permease [Treponema sp.]